MNSLQQKLVQIETLKSEIDLLGEIDDEILKKIQYKFRLDWNYYSNRIEGGTLTREETRSVMVGNITVGGKPIKDVIEMNGHDQVVLDILKIGKGQMRLSERKIKEIHKAIMYETDPKLIQLIGQWKKQPNHIINYQYEKIDFSQPSEVPDKMHDLLNRTNAELDKLFIAKYKKNVLHPLFVACDFHIDYVSIHPFYDGNGRTSRIFTNLILITTGYPPIIISDEDKKKYYQFLADIQVYGGDRNLFYDFIASLLIKSLQLVLDGIQGNSLEESDDIEKRLFLINQKFSMPSSHQNIFHQLNKASERLTHTFSKIQWTVFNDKENWKSENGIDLWQKIKERNIEKYQLEICHSHSQLSNDICWTTTFSTSNHRIEKEYTEFVLSQLEKLIK